MNENEIDPGEVVYASCHEVGCMYRNSGEPACRDLCEGAIRARRVYGLRIPARPRNSAGVATMARLMQRTRDERDFGGAVDEDA